MRIGVPKEIKAAERRVALLPDACAALVAAGHDVFVQAGAGQGAGFDDALYAAAGVHVVGDAAALYGTAQLIVKVKEPLAGDLALLRSDHVLFCYLHLAADKGLVEALCAKKLTAVAFETVVEQGADGALFTPLLAPMSAIAGRLAVQIGTWHLHAPRGGRGVLLGGVQGASAGRVTIVGAGVAGREALALAYGMGARVSVLDVNEGRLAALAARFPGVEAVVSSDQTLRAILPETDLLVGAVYVVGRRAPHVVTPDLVALMPKGSVIVDISIDQGGCVATSRPCTHEVPSYEVDGVIHSAITNLPAAVPHTASVMLSAVVLPYVQQLVAGEWTAALRAGVNVEGGALRIVL